MRNHKEFSDLYWWHMTVDPHDEPSVGQGMIRNVLVWLISVIAVFATLAAAFQGGAPT